MDPTAPAVRYDGIAAWYDEAARDSARHHAPVVSELLGPGSGRCLDVGCGTGLYLDAIASTGRVPIGLELSADQLRVARRRATRLVQGDAARLPFADGSFDAVVTIWTSTDVDDFATVMREVARVLSPGGTFVFYGVHPCFNGPWVESRDDGALIVHPGYRRVGRQATAPWWAPDGIRTKVGGMVHIPLADLLNTIIGAGIRITTVIEPGGGAVPVAVAIRGDQDTGGPAG